MNESVVLAVKEDLPEIIALFNDCIRRMEEEKIFQWDALYLTMELFEADIRDKALFLHKSSDYINGVIVLNEEQPVEYQRINWNIMAKRVLVIHRLAVHPNKQGQGIGQLLMDFAEAYAKEHRYEAIRLEAYSGNPSALRFYENRSYKRVGEIVFPRRKLPFYCYEKFI